MIFGIPVWLFGAVAVVSLFVGITLRRYFDNRRIREEKAHQEQVKAMKKQLKYDKKKAKAKNGKK